MPRDWSMQTGKWAVFLEGCESSSGPVCPGTRNFWKELERKLLKRYVETTYTKVIFQSHIDQLRWCLSSGCTHHIRLTEISGNLGLLDLFSISLLASKDGKPTFTLRIQQRITTSSPICVLMNTTGLTPNKGQQLRKWQDHIVDSLIRCPLFFKSIQQCWNAFEIPLNGSELIWKLQPLETSSAWEVWSKARAQRSSA